jgi:Homeodomain-like domain
VVGKEIAVKKYVVRLSAEERAQLDELIRKGKRSAQLLTKARILLKADVSEVGEGWSDSRIAAALDTSIATIERRWTDDDRNQRAAASIAVCVQIDVPLLTRDSG